MIGAAALPANGLLATPLPAPGLTPVIPFDVGAASGAPDEGPVTLSIFLFNPPATAGFAVAGTPGGLTPLAVGFGFCPTAFPP